MSCVVDGTVPPSSGLSSSSALVCCAGLVTMEANQKSLSKVKCFNFESFHNIKWLRGKKFGFLISKRTSVFSLVGSCWDMCQVWALHWRRGRRHGPVHLIPGWGRNCTLLLFNYMLLKPVDHNHFFIHTIDIYNITMFEVQRSCHISSDLNVVGFISFKTFSMICQAKLIEFQPLKATDVKLPDGAVFVISNCCKEMNKAASSHYNIRVVECRIATKVQWSRPLSLSLTLGVVYVKGDKYILQFKFIIMSLYSDFSKVVCCWCSISLGVNINLFKVQRIRVNSEHQPACTWVKMWFWSIMSRLLWPQVLAQARGLDSSKLLKLCEAQKELGASLEEMLALVEEVLHPEPYTREEICKVLHITPEQFTTQLLSANTLHSEWQHSGTFWFRT